MKHISAPASTRCTLLVAVPPEARRFCSSRPEPLPFLSSQRRGVSVSMDVTGVRAWETVSRGALDAVHRWKERVGHASANTLGAVFSSSTSTPTPLGRMPYQRHASARAHARMRAEIGGEGGHDSDKFPHVV